MKKFTLLFLLLLFFNALLFAQQWNARYNGSGNGMDEIKGMVVDNSGNVYVTGYSFTGANDNDYVTIKYNTSGVQQWLARYNGPGSGSDVANSIAIDNSGNVYVTGYSDKLTGTYIDNDAATVKYSPAGTQLWVARYDGGIQRSDAGNAVKADGSGNVYITGYTTVRNGAYTKKDYLTVKYNTSGGQQWKATYNGPANQDDEAVAVGLDPSGNVYITGTSFAGKDPVGEQDYLTIKYNSSGAQLWTARYNGPVSEPDYATALAVDNSGNAYVTGYSRGIDLDYATVKYNTNGVRQWVARYNGPANNGDLAFAIKVDNAGNVYVTGSDQKTAYNADYLTIKYNAGGVQQWTARYNGTKNDNDEANDIAVDNAGNVYVTGWTNGVSPAWDMTTIKYNGSGVQQWVKTYNGPKDSADAGNKIALDGQGNVYVAGASAGKKTAWDYITIKYTSAGALIADGKIAVPDEPRPFILSQNYPNPFSRVTKIKFDIPVSMQEFTKVKLTVFDTYGKAIASLIDASLKAGSYQVQWNAAKYASGVYYYKLSAGSLQEMKKMILVK